MKYIEKKNLKDHHGTAFGGKTEKRKTDKPKYKLGDFCVFVLKNSQIHERVYLCQNKAPSLISSNNEQSTAHQNVTTFS